jgi:hypothetical protein
MCWKQVIFEARPRGYGGFINERMPPCFESGNAPFWSGGTVIEAA